MHPNPCQFGQRRSSMFNSYNSDRKFDIKGTVNSDFNKKFVLTNDESPAVHQWTLPAPEEMFKTPIWKDKYLVSAKNQLNGIKGLLSKFNLSEWHSHTKRMNHSGEVFKYLRWKISPELLTQAWCKFYEVAASTNLIPNHHSLRGHLNTVHLCEAPGAFISSLNHFLKTNYPEISWSWLASTLNPHHEGNNLTQMINDDRFILHTQDHWVWGVDGTGDILNPANSLAIIEAARHKFAPLPVMLVTADGSTDCQGEPGEQEGLVAGLHFCETITALQILSKGGSFLLKMFTVFECDSVCLLYLLCCLFESVETVKPSTSKEGNSEMYVVCTGYRGRHFLEPILPTLMANYSSHQNALFPLSVLPDSFLTLIRKLADYYKDIQIKVLEWNIKTFERGFEPGEEEFIMGVRKYLSRSFIGRYSIYPLRLPHYFIVGNEAIFSSPILNLDARLEERVIVWGGPGARVCCNNHTCVQDQLALWQLCHAIEMIQPEWTHPTPVCWFHHSQITKNNSLLKIMTRFGKAIGSFKSSKFCQGSILSLWNEAALWNNKKYCSKQPAVENIFIFNQLNKESTRVCDLSYCDWWQQVDASHKDMLAEVCTVVRTLQLHQTLVITGMPFLSRVNVGVIYILGHFFEKVGLCDPSRFGYTVVFSNMKNIILVSIFENLLQRLAEEVGCLHSVISINKLCDGDFYNCITVVNHIQLRNSSLQVVKKLLNAVVKADKPSEDVC